MVTFTTFEVTFFIFLKFEGHFEVTFEKCPKKQGRSLFSLKTLKIPDLFSFFSFFFSPVFEIFRRRPDANFQVFGKSWGVDGLSASEASGKKNLRCTSASAASGKIE